MLTGRIARFSTVVQGEKSDDAGDPIGRLVGHVLVRLRRLEGVELAAEEVPPR